MGHLALLAAAGSLALLSWGWVDRVLDVIWPWYEPRTEEVEESVSPEPSATPVSEDEALDDELRAIDEELDALLKEGTSDLNDIGEGL